MKQAECVIPVYQSREFWRNVATSRQSDQVEVKDRGRYLFAYSLDGGEEGTILFLGFDNFKQFEKEWSNITEEAKSLGLTKLSLDIRGSDSIQIPPSFVESHGGKKLVDLSLCGVEISQEIIDQLSDRPFPEGYSLEQVSYDDISDKKELYQMILENFPEGFASSAQQIQDRFRRGHLRGQKDGKERIYHLIEDNEGNLAAFSLTLLNTNGALKGTMHLGMAVTDHAHRRQGLYRALLRARFKVALERGYQFAFTESDVTTSKPILEKLGLEEFDKMTIYHFEL